MKVKVGNKKREVEHLRRGNFISRLRGFIQRYAKRRGKNWVGGRRRADRMKKNETNKIFSKNTI